MLQRGNRVFNIDPPTSPNAIMRRAEPLTPSCGGPSPYRGENSGSDRHINIKESLTSNPELENSLGRKRTPARGPAGAGAP